MMNENLPNGLSQIHTKQSPMISRQFNGLGSTNSSRDPSPSTRFQQIPSAQLPPSRIGIPPSQLPPPTRPQFDNITSQNNPNLSITPFSSPKVQAFSTSTPVIESAIDNGETTDIKNCDTFTERGKEALENKDNDGSTRMFTHSATSQFTNVNRNTQLVQENKGGTMKPEENGERLLNSYFPHATGPTVQRQNQSVANSNQNPTMQTSQGVRTNNNNPNQMISPQNFPRNQSSQINKPPFNLPNAMPRPMGSQSPYHNQPVTSQAQRSMPNPPYNQGNPQNIPAVIPPQSYQNQSRAHLHNNRYPMQQQQLPSVSQGYQTQPVSSQSFQSATASLQGLQAQAQTFQPPLNSTPAFQPQYGNNQQFQYGNTQQTKPIYPGGNNQHSVTHSGFNRLWGRENHDLLQSPFILPQSKLEPPKVSLGQDFLDAVNCSPDIFRCTVTKIPESTSLLQKTRLPLGVLIHPFKDLNHLPVIQCNTIVRCRACRTYINPFVFFADSKRWKCNLCYRINDLPDEFQFDPVTKTYGDPSRRPEVKSSTIEYIAPAEYMIRPPQPAVYLYLMDVSRLAVETGYLHTACTTISSELANIPGDARTQIGFLAYDSALHFYSLSEGQNQPHEMTVLDIDDIFLPCPDNLLVNLQDRMEMVSDLLTQLPTRYTNNNETNSALGAALQVAYKMMSATGGRVTVFQVALPNIGPGALTSREDPNQRSSPEVPHLNPANDFYKRLALECSGQQIAVDLFVLNSQFVDLSTISGISRFSGGCIHHFPLFKANRILQNEAFERSLRRYVTRKIGFEAVMRIRCTRGLSIHTFHGNFFVRSTDLLSLPNINPDAGFGMQVSIEENLTDVQTVCFQAALLYTSSKGERRIRVHTMCLPVANNVSDVINSADQQCIIGLLSKMAVDRSMQSSLSDAREAFLNVAIDILTSYKISLNMASGVTGLMVPDCLKLLPLYISALLKNLSFRIGISTRLDDRVKGMCDMKSKPLPYLIQMIYPDLYPVHNLEEHNVVVNEEDEIVHQPPHLQLTARSLDSHGAYLMDVGEHMMLFVCSNVSIVFLNSVLGLADFSSIGDDLYELPLLENQPNKRLHSFINYLNDEKPFPATLQVIRENSPSKIAFYERLVEDRLENSLSYHEFLQHIKTQVK